jgi:hypothetical protein
VTFLTSPALTNPLPHDLWEGVSARYPPRRPKRRMTKRRIAKFRKSFSMVIPSV